MVSKFIRGISANGCSRVGVIVAIFSLLAFLLFELLQIVGVLSNALLGLFVYLGFPMIFLTGLALIVIGWKLLSRRTGKSLRELLAERFSKDDLYMGNYCSRMAWTAIVLTFVCLVVIGGASAR
ncbi:MAG: hypothetical protein P9M15_00360, partial [Candidatus Electryoneaceae bacterium]|nr:hypothetical protein [Candidatus Electryoneaceae bacterium]